MNNNRSPRRKYQISGALAAIALLPLAALVAGCPFSVETFQRRCDKPADCSDGNPCTEDKCTQGICDNPDKTKGSPCGSGGDSVCDGKGKCLECLSNADCAANHPMTPICDLAAHECVSCTDGKKNGNELDVDCGGPDCGACLGKPCDPQNGCGTGTFCAPTDNICCSTACDQKCEACTKAKTGQPDGTCAAVPFGMDPDGECANQGSCGGSPNKCRCEDGIKNADETDIDCGGATCARCQGGQMCGMNSDCVAGAPECTTQKICCTSTCDGVCFTCNGVGQCVAQPIGYADPLCQAGQACGPLGTSSPCIGKAGAGCTNGSKCLSGVCTGSLCQKSTIGKPCSDSNDCAMGTCQNYVCTP